MKIVCKKIFIEKVLSLELMAKIKEKIILNNNQNEAERRKDRVDYSVG